MLGLKLIRISKRGHWPSVDLLPVWQSGQVSIHLRVLSSEMLKVSLTEMCLETAHLIKMADSFWLSASADNHIRRDWCLQLFAIAFSQ